MKASMLTEHEITIDTGPQALENKLSAAVHIAVFGADQIGIKTKAQLMWPLKKFSDADAQKQAAILLDRLLSLQLASLPHQVIEQIQQDQDKGLSLIAES